ncbi:MAG: zinc-binding dehydrogenase [Planctomycetota bacterium]|nr:zinc-binding dehydrogenase [Planctomycetota bacterium]
MRAVIVNKQGAPVAANVEFSDAWPKLAPGEPGAGCVVVRTLATAFNQMDLWVGRGVPGLELSYPRVSGCDACGVVEAVGEGVDPAWKGRRVILNAAYEVASPVRPDDPPEGDVPPAYELIGEHVHGMMREQFVAPAANLVAVDGCDPLEAAAFGLCFLTAWSMMVSKGGLRHGSSVLITGIGGGVATSALAIAKHFGCRVAVTSRHQWKLDRARDLGADVGILDDGKDWSKGVRAWTNKRGVDMAVDSSGKATHLACVKSLARGGVYATCGCTSGPDAVTDLARLFWNQLRFVGSTMGSTSELAETSALFAAGKLKPVIDQVFKPEQCVQAYQRLEAAEQFGKIVLDWR